MTDTPRTSDRPDPFVVASLLNAHPDAVAAEVLRRLAIDPDTWRPLLRDFLDLAAHAAPEALLAAAHDLAPTPTPEEMRARYGYDVAVARALVDAHGRDPSTLDDPEPPVEVEAEPKVDDADHEDDEPVEPVLRSGLSVVLDDEVEPEPK